MKNPHRVLGLLAALPLAGGLLAQDPAGVLPSPASPPAQAPWIQAELIVFRNLDTSTAADEQWPAKPALGYPVDLRFVTDPAAAADASAQPDASAASEPSSPSAATPPAPQPFVQLAPSERLLGEAAARIASSPDYRVLAHLAWRQPAPPRGGDNVLVTGGQQWGEHWELEGYVSISRANFVHVETRLWLNDFAAAPGAEAAAPTTQGGITLPAVPQPPVPPAAPVPQIPAGAAADAEPAVPLAAAEPQAEPAQISFEPTRASRTVLLATNRRIAPGELHHLDHPLFGVVLRVEPFDPAQPSAPGAGTVTPPDASAPAAASP